LALLFVFVALETLVTAFLTAFFDDLVTDFLPDLAADATFFADLVFAISGATAPATPPTNAPTAAPTGPTNDPAAAPAAAPPAICKGKDIPLFVGFFAGCFFAIQSSFVNYKFQRFRWHYYSTHGVEGMTADTILQALTRAQRRKSSTRSSRWLARRIRMLAPKRFRGARRDSQPLRIAE
jgi:hypothetical protein